MWQYSFRLVQTDQLWIWPLSFTTPNQSTGHHAKMLRQLAKSVNRCGEGSGASLFRTAFIGNNKKTVPQKWCCHPVGNMQVRVKVHKKQVKRSLFWNTSGNILIICSTRSLTVFSQKMSVQQKETNTRTPLTYLIQFQSIWVLITQTRQKSLGIYSEGKYHLNE